MRQFIFIQGISLRVIILFGVAILGTFLSDYLNEIKWFGDYFDIIDHSEYMVDTYDVPKHEEILRHGSRHVWYNIGFILLFILQSISLIWYVVDSVNKKKF